MSEGSSEGAGVRGRRASFGFIFALAVMNSVSFGLMIPILPKLIEQFAGGDTAAASEFNALFATAWGLMQFFCGPVLGMMADRWGRRPVLLLSLFGLGIDFLFMALAPNLWWLFLGRILNGATAASFSTANAYLADITPPDQRARTFGLMSSAFSFGFVIGPAVGGLIGGIWGLRAPFVAAAVLTLVNCLYGLLVLPESLPPEKRAKAFDWRKANPLGALKLLRSRPGLLGLTSVGFLYQVSHIVLPTCFVLYTTYRYGWSTEFLGLTFFITGVLGVIVQWLVVGPFVARFGERNAVLFGAACGAFGFAWYAWAPTGWLYLAAAPVFALWGLVMPGLQSLMTRRVQPHEQGQLQGANQSLAGIAAIIGPPLYGVVFAWSLRHESTLQTPGLAIYLAAALMVGAILLAMAYARPQAAPAPAE